MFPFLLCFFLSINILFWLLMILIPRCGIGNFRVLVNIKKMFGLVIL